MTHNTIYNWSLTLCLLLGLTACHKNDGLDPVEYVGIDKITRLELSPNGPVILRNGDGELHFYVKAYYMGEETVKKENAEGTEEKKPKEIAYLSDRLPMDQIKITASDGQTFTADKGYTTKTTDDEITFTASLGSVVSAPAKVVVKDAPVQPYTKLRIPVVFKAIYSPKEKHYANAFTDELLAQILDRANKVFANQLFKAPSSTDVGIEFYLEDASKNEISESDNKDLYAYIKKNQMADVDKYLTVWVLYSGEVRKLKSQDVGPAYTLGDPSALPGLNLKKVTKIDEIKDIEPVDVGITISYRELYNTLSRGIDGRFEQQLGRFYGLLPTGKSNIGKKDTGKDLDYCADTYSYEKGDRTRLKRTPHIDGQQSFLYFSYDVMDDYTTATTITVDQAKRIRQVISDCPYRRQGQK